MASSPSGGAFGLSRHHLPVAQLDALARSDAGAGAVQVLSAAERTCRLMLLFHLLGLCGQRPDAFGPLPGTEQAWKALTAVQQRAAADLDVVLMHPQVGTWLAGTLRMLKDVARPRAPLWSETGWLYALIFAAAVRAGLPIRTRVPVRDGAVLLPTLGLVSAGHDSSCDVAEAEVRGGRATVTFEDRQVVLPADPSRDGPGWWALRRMEAQAGGERIEVWLDDIDPYRDLADAITPDRLTPDSVARWSALFGEAWQILCERWPAYARCVAAGLKSISPLPIDPEANVIRSASTADAFGAVLLEQPVDSSMLAVTVVHEMQHVLLGGLLRMIPLHTADDGRRFYAPWRDDPRPLSGLHQGAYAFLGMSELWRRLYESSTGPDTRSLGFEFAYARRQTGMAMRVLSRSPALTGIGHRFVEGMVDHLRVMNAVRLPVELERAAWLAVASHRTVWRLRNVTVEPESVARLTGDWLAGRAPGSEPVRARLTDAGTYPGVHRATVIRQQIARDATVPTVDCTAWAAGYTDPGDHHWWSELALGLADRRLPGWHAMLRDPSLVREVFVAARAAGANPDPVGVAVWLGGLGSA